MPRTKTDFAVRRTQTGLGLFATRIIPRGKRIIEYTGPRILNEEVESREGKYFFGVNKKWSIDGSPRTNTARYINHSCKPNAEPIISGNRIWIWSRKKIKPGDEITYDYGKEYFEGLIEPIGCKCEKCGVRRKGSAAKKSRCANRKKPISLSGNSPRGRVRAPADEPAS
ncbi:MAG: SET domain-containing protein [Acidobacteriota bacterium]